MRAFAASPSARMSKIARVLGSLGLLRTMLAVTTILLILAAPYAREETDYSAWAIMRGTVAPALMVIVAFVLPLDITMSRIFMSDGTGADRYKRIIRVECLLLAALLLTWTPIIALHLGYLK